MTLGKLIAYMSAAAVTSILVIEASGSVLYGMAALAFMVFLVILVY
jgi:hypothetical protein